jgi:glycosyltransferase involved in cell wall biosynthesis
VAQASLAEGLGLSPLEALACGVPAVCTAVGGLAANLNGYARLIPRGDFQKMAGELAWVAAHPQAARAQALEGRQFVIYQWSREKAFQCLADVIAEVLRQTN